MKRILIATLILLSVSACSFSFERGNTLEPGDVQGVAVDENANVLPFAQVRVEGTTRLVRADEQGAFLVRGLAAGPWVLRLSSDQDGDGYPERSRVQKLQVRYGNVGGQEAVAGVSLGRVEVRPVASISGRVITPASDDARSEARVMAVRVFENEALTTSSEGESESFVETLAAEAEVGSANGAFVFPALAEGDVQLLAQYTDPESGELLMASTARLTLVPGERLEDLVLTLTRPPDISRRAIIHVSPEPEEGALVKIAFQTPGEQQGIVVPGGFGADDEGVQPYSGPIVVDGIDPGRVDLVVTTLEGAAFSPSRTVPPDVSSVEFHVELQNRNPCLERDCDDDDVQALCPYGELCDNLRTCAAQCAGAVGDRAQEITCEQNDEIFDCDDDGDGQPDTTEPPACLGTLFGTDLDGDGVCSNADLIPQCAQAFDATCQNDPAPTPSTPPPFSGYSENLPPTLDAELPLQAFAQPGQSTRLELSNLGVNDPEGDTVVALLPRTQSDRGGLVALENADDVNDAVIFYTPPADFSDEGDAFDFALSDGTHTLSFRLAIAFDGQSEAPIANDDDESGAPLEDEALFYDILANDEGDIDVQSVEFILPENFPHSVEMQSGLMRFLSAPNYNGPLEDFRYTVANAQGDRSEPAVIRLVEVVAVNDIPLTQQSSLASGQEDQPLVFDIGDVIENVDDEARTTTPLGVTPAEAGVASVDAEGADGLITFTPADDYCGSATIEYDTQLGEDNSFGNRIEVTVECVNDAPEASQTAPTGVAANAGEAVTLSVNEIFVDADDDALTIVNVIAPPEVTVDISDPTRLQLESTLAQNFELTVFASDGIEEAAHTFNLIVGSSNTPPVPIADLNFSVNEDEQVSLDVRANDTDAEGDVIALEVIDQPSLGSVVVEADLTILYTPNANANGQEQFSYRLLDADFASDVATVIVNVVAQDDTEVLFPSVVIQAQEDQPNAIAINAELFVDVDVDNDVREYFFTDPLLPAGTLTHTDESNAQATYDLAPNFCGNVSVPLTIRFAGTDQSSVAELQVNCENDPLPSVAEEIVSPLPEVNTPNPVVIDLLANEDAANVDDEVLAIEITSVSSGATLTSATNERIASLSITPDHLGPVDINYTLSDADFSESKTLTFMVVSSGVAPNIQNTTLADILEGAGAVTVNVAGADNDPEGQTINYTYDFAGNSPNLSFTAGPGDEVTITADPNFCGAFSFLKTGTTTDNRSAPAATVDGVIVCEDDAPIANPVSRTPLEDTTFTINAQEGVTELDNDSLIYAFDILPSEFGTLTQDGPDSPTASLTLFTHFCGSFSLGYTVTDQTGPALSANSTVDVDVTCEDDPLTLVDDIHTMLQGDTFVPVDLIANDSIPDGIETFSATPPGQLTLTGTTVTLNDPNFVGVLSFDYDIIDNTGATSGTANFELTIAAPPVLNDDNVNFTLGVEASANVLVNDNDTSSILEPSTLVFLAPPPDFVDLGNGDFSINTTQAPPGGIYVLNYEVDDTFGNTYNAELILNFVPPPNANDRTYNLREADGPSYVLNVVDDQTPNTLTLKGVSTPANGTTTFTNLPNPQVTYDHGGFIVTPTTFTYMVGDSNFIDAESTRSVTLNIDRLPQAEPDAFTLDTSGAVNTILNVFFDNGSGADSDDNGFIQLDDVNCTLGVGTVASLSTGEVQYEVAASTTGTDNCTYIISDGVGQVATGSLIVTLGIPPTVPVDDFFQVFAGETTTLNLTTNEAPSDFIDALQALSGVNTTAIDNQSVSYLAPTGFVGKDRFEYTLRNSAGLSSPASAQVELEVLTRPNDKTFRLSGSTFTSENGLPFFEMAVGQANNNPTFGPVAFGGFDGIAFSDTTFEYIGGAWVPQAPAQTPPARAQMASATTSSAFVIYGGIDETGDLQDQLWAYNSNANAWNILTPGGTPPPKLRGASMASFQFVQGQPNSQVIVLMGGVRDDDSLNEQIFFLDLINNRWDEVIPDTTIFGVKDATLTFTGYNGSGHPQLVRIGGDFSVASDPTIDSTLITLVPNQIPSLPPDALVSFLTSLDAPTSGHRVVEDPAAPGEYLLFEGFTREDFLSHTRTRGRVYRNTDLTGTGAWVLQNFEMPDALALAGVAVEGGNVILVGGDLSFAESNLLNDTLRLDFIADRVVQQVSTATVPSPREFATMSEIADGTLMVGGRDDALNALAETWRWNANTRQWGTHTTPFQFFDMASATDEGSGEVCVHGGRDTTEAIQNQTWCFDPNTALWTLRSTAGPSVSGARMTYSSANNALLLYGGFTNEDVDGNHTYLLSTWLYDVDTDTWTDTGVSAPDFGRTGHNLVSGLVEETPGTFVDYVLLLHGFNQSQPMTDAFRWSGSDWTFMPSTGQPFDLSEAAMSYDAGRLQFSLSHGVIRSASDTQYSKDVYEIMVTGSALSYARRIFMSEALPINPERRRRSCGAFDGVSPLVFGGKAQGLQPQ